MKRLLMLAAAGAGGYLAWQGLRPRYDFRGKNVLITGGSRGLGLVLARQLAARGARIGICARDHVELEEATAELRYRGAEVASHVCDLTDQSQVRTWIEEMRHRLGPIDVLINNAGVIGVGPLDTMRLEDFELALKTHLWGPIYTTLEVIPEMKARRSGRIINIASIGGKIAIPHLVPYSASKFALVGFSNGLRAELGRFGITVTTICPGLMRTGSHLNAEFKGQHRKEYAWFSFGGSLPGPSMSADHAARKVIAAIERGDAEVVLSLPAKLLVAAQAVAPTLTSDALAVVNALLPESGGVGAERIRGKHSRGVLPAFVTTLSDRAAAENNEVSSGRVPNLPAR